MSTNGNPTESFHLLGEGNKSKITNTQKSLFQVDYSNLCIDNSSELRLKGEHNNLYLRDCANFHVSGSENDVHGERIIASIVHGEDNGISARSIVDLVLSGSGDLCKLGREVSPKIYGNENRVIASENVNLLVCGSSNCVAAQKNFNLKIRGNYTNVVAYHSCNITVDGQRNQVSVKDTSVAHHLMRVPIGSVNHVRFTGSPLKCCVYEGISFPSIHPAQFLQDQDGMGKGIGEGCCHNQLFGPLHPPRLPTNEDGNVRELELHRRPTRVLIPQLDISYVDRISISRNHYILGIFHFQVESWKENPNEGGESSSILRLQIASSELDGKSFSSAVVGSGKERYTIIVGRKDGIMQTLKLSGPRIMRGDENEFLVDLDPESGNPEGVEEEAQE